MLDLIIIGAGPAGLTAAIYAARAGLDFTVLEQDGHGGGQITAAHQVQNYPACPNISGYALGEAFRRQALELGAQLRYAMVTAVEDHWDCLSVTTQDGEILEARTIIAATGAAPRRLGISGEELPGVSYCALCDGAFFAGKTVAVVGGGDTAVEDGLYLAGICQKVTMILRRDVFRAAKTRVELLLSQPNVKVLYNTRIGEIQGAGKVERLILEGDHAGTLSADALFVAVGIAPTSEYLRGLPLSLDNGSICADETGRTSVPGFFVAGDLRKKPLRQVVTAVADGANALSAAMDYFSAG